MKPIATLALILATSTAAIAAPVAPSPSSEPTPGATWAPQAVPTIPPDFQLRATQIQAQNIVFGLLKPYCDTYGGFVGAQVSQGDNPYPVFVVCVKAKLRVESPAKVTPL